MLARPTGGGPGKTGCSVPKSFGRRQRNQTMALINAQAVIGSRTMPKHSPDTPMNVSRQKLAAMLAVINKRWLTNGWRVLEPSDAEPMALAWIEALDRAGVDWRRYNDLYHRMIKLRSERLAAGLECDDFSVDLMIACWKTLRQEERDRDISKGRYLPPVAASDCDHCFGTRIEIVEGKGARPCKFC